MERTCSMDIGRIAEQSNMIAATKPKPAAQETEKKETTLASDNTDKFVESEATYTPAYTKAMAKKSDSRAASDNEAESIKIEKPKSFKTMKNEAFKSMVSDTVTKQSNDWMSKITGTETEEETDTDYWGIEATAQRLLDFAVNLADGDESKIAELRDAVTEGFKQAGMSVDDNGETSGLPDICLDTYDRVMEMFDNWENGDETEETTATTVEE